MNSTAKHTSKSPPLKVDIIPNIINRASKMQLRRKESSEIQAYKDSETKKGRTWKLLVKEKKQRLKIAHIPKPNLAALERWPINTEEDPDDN